MTIKLELQEILQDRGMSQRQLAEVSGVRQERISQICRGFVDRLELDHIDAICNALDIYPWEWIVYTPSNNVITDEDKRKALEAADATFKRFMDDK